MKKHIITACFCASLFVVSAFTQTTSTASNIDSLVAMLPHLRDTAKLDALNSLINLSIGLAAESHYMLMYLEEAQNQKNVRAEGWALTALARIYFSQFDTDSVFVYGKKAISFNREHKQYNFMFYAKRTVIRRYEHDGQILTAFREAQEAYEEAKKLQEKLPMALMLGIIANIYHTIGQYEEAMRYMTESVELASQIRKKNELFMFENYIFLAYMCRYLDRPKEVLRYSDSIEATIKRIHTEKPSVKLQRLVFQNEYHRAIAYASLNRSERSLQSIRKAEEVFDTRWIERNSYFGVILNAMYGAYFHSIGERLSALDHYSKLLEYYKTHCSEDGIHHTKKNMAQIYFEMGDHKTAAEMCGQMMRRKEELNKMQFYAQLNEFRTIYELDKAQLESHRRSEAIRQQQFVITGQTIAFLALMMIAASTAWSRKKIAEVNHGLYRQIEEQYRLEKELEKKNRYIQVLEKSEKIGKWEKDEDEEMLESLKNIMKDQLLFTNCELKLKDVVEKTGINEKVLQNCIKNKTGMNFSEYINNMRLLYARELLLEKGKRMTVEAIARDSGFKSRNTFYNLFREKFGANPGKMVKISQKQDENYKNQDKEVIST